MKPEPGLHKQVSSIFDGVKIPAADSYQNGPDKSVPETGINMSTDQPANPVPSVGSDATGPAQQAADVPVYQPSDGNNPAAKPPGGPPSTDLQVKKITPPGIKTKIREKITSYLNDEDPEKARQKKMTVLVGILFVVFASVLAFVFKGPGAVNAKGNEEQVVVNVTSELSWTKPDVIPEDMRDPMSSKPKESLHDEVEKPKQDYSRFVVTGIVQGLRGNSAIVSGKVLFEGEEIFGARIMKINSDSVEFEMNGQTWTQPIKK